MNRHQGRHWLLGSNCGLWVSAPVSRVVTERIHVKDEGDLVGVLDTAEPEREDWGDTGPPPCQFGVQLLPALSPDNHASCLPLLTDFSLTTNI